ncbi:hematopoietic death receptor isoform X2 [Hippoglossus stenolepis]|uniref:hematopoietic death receptor isoform X1 n=1 Tax=Hippoglossus stenolepis TaxID=195615 RepID=UPI001FAEBA80|nr:hematopoietic death receptor isoform X1 [Hippoglossus stenolepis]XP_047197398.1 hematopoietic death receptor isoform X2 [Hippoglossus stenolepis]
MTFISTSFSVLVLLLSTTGVFPRPGIDFGSRTKRDVHCTGNLQYPNGNNCCLNCPAGTHVTSHCIKTGERGQCQECDYETYTEHPNHLNQCLKCTKCRPDQEVVRHCMPTQDTECQCKAGRFCDPHQACEICKRCSKCEKDEEIERNCTSTTNTECKKIQPSSGSVSANTPVIVIIVISSLVVVAGGVAVFIWKKCRSTDTGRDLPEEIKVEQDPLKHYADSCPTEERGYGEIRRPSSSHWPLVRAKSSVTMEDKHKLCESLNSSASNSHHSLTGLPSALPVTAFHTRPVFARMPDRREEDFPKLNPVNDEESLRKCFEYFEDMEIDQHKRFFRNLGIRDNVIKSKELLPYEDKIHELLNIWVEKEGREASLNDLLKALLDLKQRQTAETVMGKAIQDGHYVECPSESEILY